MISLENKLRDACIDASVEYKNVPADGQWHGANLSDDTREREVCPLAFLKGSKT